MYTEQKIKKELLEIFAGAGVRNPSRPLKIYVDYEYEKHLAQTIYNRYADGTVEPVAIRFNGTAVDNLSEEDIKQVMLHEAAHYITTVRTGELHEHDAVFKAVCAEIGAKFDGETPPALKRVDYVEGFHHYSIYCPHCNTTLGNWSKKNSMIKRLSAGEIKYFCNDCGCEVQLIER